MKNLLVSALILFNTILLQAGNGQYEAAMQKNLQHLQQANDKNALLEVANTFERIAGNEPKEWLPSYYAALAYINMSFKEDGLKAKDASLEKAAQWIGKAAQVAPHESEIVALQGYQSMMSLSADPATRGQSMTPKTMQLLGQAMQMNPENPRAYYLMAQMEFGTAQFFGNSTDKACALAQKSVVLFEKTGEEKSLSPAWGRNGARELAANCTSK